MPALPARPVSDGRSQVFQRLKPPCVALGEAARTLNGPNADSQEVARRLEDVKETLSAVTKSPYSLDDQLAGYVFFPLALVLKASQTVSIRCLELAFQCLAILIAQGWRSRVQSETAVQIVLLCTMMAGKNPTGLASSSSTDELQAAALLCLEHLFEVLDAKSEISERLASEAYRPQLGMTISTLLDATLDGRSIEVQTAGVKSLQALLKSVTSRDTQAAFLPGIVSKLTQVLTPQTKQRRHHSILISSLEILQFLFTNTLGTEIAQAVMHQQNSSQKKAEQTTSTVITSAWLESAATRLRPAVAKIVRLKEHGRLDVTEALAQFCIVLMRQCRSTLANCVPLALETVLYLSSEETGDSLKFRVEALFSAEPGLAKQMINTLYDWLQSLTTRMQSTDEQSKVRRIRQISTAYSMMAASGTDTASINRLLAGALRDSVVINLSLSSPKRQAAEQVSSTNTLALVDLDKTQKNAGFSSPLVKHTGQKPLLDSIEGFAQVITQCSTSEVFSAELARALHQSQGDIQVASFWLLLNATEAAVGRSSEVDAFLTFDSGATSHMEYLEDLYSYSLDILTRSSDEVPDERLQSLALRTLALRARTAGGEFRHELIDALYPVLHTLATPSEQLQQDSVTTLNIMTASCGYVSVQDLIVENVDYLTNAVALKLNSFDVSPQAPQVLLMMVRLAGPKLLPYLEDTIDSIFAALEDYHGYPLLVELLFRVLSAVAEEGVKAPQLAIESDSSGARRSVENESSRAADVSVVAEILRERCLEEQQMRSLRSQEHSHPERPWKEASKDREKQAENDSDQEEQDDVPEEVEAPPPAPKQYSLLLKISELTQHYLPSASASLRASLLALIRTTTPALAKHENSFLPLINTLWPEVTSRLDDSEPHVVSSALDIIALLCENAREFMRSRILQLWPGLVEMHQKISKDIIQVARPKNRSSEESHEVKSKTVMPSAMALNRALVRMQQSHADYSDTSLRTMWSSLVNAMTSIVENVELTPDQFDEAVSMLEPVIEEIEVRRALEKQNADAVWLIRMRNGAVSLPKAPNMESTVCRLAAIPG